MEINRANAHPHAVTVEAGKTYYWCACGQSKTQPFCDGSHQGSVFSPTQYVPTESGIVWLCGCKQSRHKPLCDGRHKDVTGPVTARP